MYTHRNNHKKAKQLERLKSNINTKLYQNNHKNVRQKQILLGEKIKNKYKKDFKSGSVHFVSVLPHFDCGFPLVGVILCWFEGICTKHSNGFKETKRQERKIKLNKFTRTKNKTSTKRQKNSYCKQTATKKWQISDVLKKTTTKNNRKTYYWK